MLGRLVGRGLRIGANAHTLLWYIFNNYYLNTLYLIIIDRLILVIELSGVQFGLKSYA